MRRISKMISGIGENTRLPESKKAANKPAVQTKRTLSKFFPRIIREFESDSEDKEIWGK